MGNILLKTCSISKVDISSDILQSFEIPVLDLETCKAKAPEDFMKKVIADKVANLPFRICSLICFCYEFRSALALLAVPKATQWWSVQATRAADF